MKSQSIIVIILFIFAACNHSDKNVQTVTKATPKYNFAILRQGNIGATLQLPAVLYPFYRVDMYPKVSGFVKNLYVDRGSIVHKGETLVVLEAPEIDQQYYAAQSTYMQAKSAYATSKDTYKRLKSTSSVPGTVAENDLEVAHNKMTVDSQTMAADYADLLAQQTEESYLTITAPFSGVITERNISLGTLVGPTTKIENNMPLLILEERDTLRLTVDIPEEDCDLVDNKTPVSFTLEALPGQTFTARISRSANALDMKYRSEAVEIDVANDKGLIKPGMYAEVSIPLKRKTISLIVPSSAIVRSTERHYIITLNNGITHYVNVQDGNSVNDSTEVYGNNLQAGDTLISNANDEIKEGVKVN
jgi:RND family efflux transporter MFP subunit